MNDNDDDDNTEQHTPFAFVKAKDFTLQQALATVTIDMPQDALHDLDVAADQAEQDMRSFIKYVLMRSNIQARQINRLFSLLEAVGIIHYEEDDTTKEPN